MSSQAQDLPPVSGRAPQLMIAARAAGIRIGRASRAAFLRLGFYVSAAILIPYGLWVFTVERGSFSRVPVAAGILLLCIVTGFLYFSTTIRFGVRFSWRQTFLAAALFAIFGLGFAGVLSILLFAYACEAVSYLRVRHGRARPSFSPNLGVVLVLALGLVVFPALNEMYFRGTQARLIFPDYNRRNIFYGINRNGFRGPEVAIARNSRPRLLFIGDSSPFGWPYRYEESFPFVVGSILKARGIDVEVVNAATIGQSIGAVRTQLPYFLEYQPDVIFLMTGVHYRRADQDYQRIRREGVSRNTEWRPFLGTPPMLVELLLFSLESSPIFARKDSAGDAAAYPGLVESFKTHLRAVVDSVRQSGARLYLVDYPTPGAERRVQEEIRLIGRESQTEYVPLFDRIGAEIADHLHDETHPDRQGHRMIAEEIANVVAVAVQSGRMARAYSP